MMSKKNNTCWLVLASVFVTGISMAWSQNKVIPIISDIISIFDVDSATAGWLSSIFCVTSVVMAVPAAFILNRFGIRMSGLISMLFTALGSVLGIFCSGFGILMVSRIIEGIGVGMISVVGPTAISMWFPKEKRGLPMGIWGSWQMVAQGFNFFLATTLTNAFGWKGMWYLGIILTIVSMVLYGLIVKAPKDEENYAPVSDGKVSIKGLKSGNVWTLGIAGFFFTFSYFGWCTWISQYWTQIVGIEQNLANNYLGYLCIIEIPVVFVIGAILDRVKNRKTVAIIASILYIPTLYISFHMMNPALIIPFVIAYPIIEGGIPTFLWTVIPETVENPKDSSIALAALTICMNLGTVIGPPVIGAITEGAGYGIAAYPLCISIIVSIILIKKVRLYN